MKAKTIENWIKKSKETSRKLIVHCKSGEYSAKKKSGDSMELIDMGNEQYDLFWWNPGTSTRIPNHQIVSIRLADSD